METRTIRYGAEALLEHLAHHHPADDADSILDEFRIGVCRLEALDELPTRRVGAICHEYEVADVVDALVEVDALRRGDEVITRDRRDVVPRAGRWEYGPFHLIAGAQQVDLPSEQLSLIGSRGNRFGPLAAPDSRSPRGAIITGLGRQVAEPAISAGTDRPSD